MNRTNKEEDCIGLKPIPAMQNLWYENLERHDGSDGHQQGTDSVCHRIRWRKLKQVDHFKWLQGGCQNKAFDAALLFYHMLPFVGHTS